MEHGSSLKRKRSTQESHYGNHVESSDSEEEFDFENIDLEKVAQITTDDTKDTNSAAGLIVRINEQESGQISKRYPTTAIARKIRLEIHKLHLLCLMSHVFLRNRWCSEDETAELLKPLKLRFKGNVHPKTTSAQFQRTRVLLEGLEAVSDLWSKSYKITSKGSCKAKWYAEDDLHKIVKTGIAVGKEVTRDDFLDSARRLQGDRDIGAQLFVAFLRSLGLTARLVCSLQALGLSVNRTNTAIVFEELVTSEPEYLSQSPSPQKQVKTQPRRLTKPKLGTPNRTTLAHTRPKPQVKLVEPIVECPYPIYWAEVFDTAAQKWYPVDPLVTDTVNKPARFEPPQSESENTLSYVVGFEKDGSVRDITHRYTKQFNAKVRRTRLENTPSGAAWWSKLLKLYKTRHRQDRNTIEDAEFAQKALAEGIPANVSDLKGHPLFVLERHLRRDEIIQPMRDCGTIRIGKTQPPVVEKVYPRKHLIKLRSSLAWYMRGRQVRVGEQPLKTIERKHQSATLGSEEAIDPFETSTDGLFADYQTDMYMPQPVINGVVPRNAYGNIDLFQPSMLPVGSTHLPNRDSERIAQLLGIDYAIAVTGFDHANRQTVPIKQGVVIASEFVDAMEAIQEVFWEEAEEAVKRAKILTALTRWSHFLRTLRIKQHVESRYGSIENKTDSASPNSG